MVSGIAFITVSNPLLLDVFPRYSKTNELDYFFIILLSTFVLV